MIETLYNNLVNHDADISCCEAYFAYINSNKSVHHSNKVFIFNSDQAVELLFSNKYILWSVWGKLYKKNLFNNIRFPANVFYGEDAAVTFKILLVIDSIVSINTPKYFYRQRTGSIIRSKYNSKTAAVLDSAEEMLEIIKKDYPHLIEPGSIGVLKANLNILSQIIFSINYKQLPEYKKALVIIQKNYKFIIKSKSFNRSEKIKVIAIKINIELYKLLQRINNWNKNKILFKN
jgi:hypothetical protein